MSCTNCDRTKIHCKGLCVRCYKKKWKTDNWNRHVSNISRYHNEKRYGGLRNAVLERDENKCQRCGTTDGKIVVHHIDENTTNNTMENLITFCQRCHASLHHSTPWVCRICGGKHCAKGLCKRCYYRAWHKERKVRHKPSIRL